MIHNINTNLLVYPVDAFIHQANCFNTMGSGIALQIKKKYPELYAEDCKTEKGSRNKLGSFSSCNLHDGKRGYNLYSQYHYGRDKRYTNYESFYTGLNSIYLDIKNRNIETVGLPYLIGCYSAGGSWRIVNAIIEEVFLASDIILFICKYGNN